jgi:hypothetical protein
MPNYVEVFSIVSNMQEAEGRADADRHKFLKILSFESLTVKNAQLNIQVLKATIFRTSQ